LDSIVEGLSLKIGDEIEIAALLNLKDRSLDSRNIVQNSQIPDLSSKHVVSSLEVLVFDLKVDE
jgi:hypothetical protein